MKISDVQARIDAKSYPPTHDYELATLKPRGVLVERLERILFAEPEIFVNQQSLSVGRSRFLDIGCSKGFFSLRAANAGAIVTGIDGDVEAVEICRDAVKALCADKPEGRGDYFLTGREPRFLHQTFRYFEIPRSPADLFDRVFVGNAHHYLFKDASGWDWVAKLAAVTAPGAIVAIEGPTPECRDLDAVLSPELRALFAEGNMAISKFFEAQWIVHSPEYTPDRQITAYIRRPMPWDWTPEDVDSQVPGDVDVEVLCENARNGSKVARAGGLVFKTYEDPSLNEAPLFPSVVLSCLAPGSNGMVGPIHDGNQFVGWAEAPLASPPLRYFEREAECLHLWCKRNVFFSRCGYIDVDAGTINFAPRPEGGLVHFDKNAVMPIRMLDYDRIERLLATLRQSYRTVREDRLAELRQILPYRDAREIEAWFSKTVQKIEEYFMRGQK